MAKYVYEGMDEIFDLAATGKVLFKNGEAVELTENEARYIRNYPHGNHRLKQVNETEAKKRQGSNPKELVDLHSGEALRGSASAGTPSTSGHGGTVVLDEAPAESTTQNTPNKPDTK